VMTVHTCLGALASGHRCAHCGTAGPRHWHPGCVRMLPPQDVDKASCENCGIVLTAEHVVPWPVAAV
jgi:hypothetical protein